MRRAAVIGLGDIARKAYLPTIGLRGDVELRLATRDPAILAELGDAYHIPARRRFAGLDALLADGPLDAAFVHAATAAHADLVPRLLDAGVPTFVDKPLTDTYAGSVRLVEHAERVEVPLMLGFNRRYVPAYAAAQAGRRDLVMLQKNEPGRRAGVRHLVFDAFIHVADTLRFLAPGPVTSTHVSGRVENGLLQHAAVTLSGDGFTAFGAMNWAGGAKNEVLQVTGADGEFEVRDLVDVRDASGGRRTHDVWAPVARQRGFEQMVTAFLAGEYLDVRDSLATHELCERIVAELS
jgi:virulence factor